MSPQPAPMPPSALQGSTDNVYTVIVRGETFQLDHTQIHFDAPNFFSTCFSSGFAEAARRVLTLQRSPTTFAIIVDYLSGYPILPLALCESGFHHTPADSGWDSLRGHCRQDFGVRMSDSENWVSCYRWSGGVESRNVVYVTYTLLATSFICRVRPWTGIGPHSPSVEPIPVDLVRASLRTKRSILDELRTHIDRGEGK